MSTQQREKMHARSLTTRLGQHVRATQKLCERPDDLQKIASGDSTVPGIVDPGAVAYASNRAEFLQRTPASNSKPLPQNPSWAETLAFCSFLGANTED
jgi:hypothetical protein